MLKRSRVVLLYCWLIEFHGRFSAIEEKKMKKCVCHTVDSSFLRAEAQTHCELYTTSAHKILGIVTRAFTLFCRFFLFLGGGGVGLVSRSGCCEYCTCNALCYM